MPTLVSLTIRATGDAQESMQRLSHTMETLLEFTALVLDSLRWILLTNGCPKSTSLPCHLVILALQPHMCRPRCHTLWLNCHPFVESASIYQDVLLV